MAAASTPDAEAVKTKKQKRTDKAVGSTAKKPRVATPVKKTQSNTLDMWFKAAAPKPSKAEPKASPSATAAKSDDADALDSASVTTSSESPAAETTDAVTRVTPPVERKRTADGVPSSAKKLVQRRIHINDPCRVCEAARTEDTSRCELRCLGCDMTVHKKCYDVQSEDPIDDWYCRRCQFILDKRAEQRVQQQAQPDDASDSASHSASSTEPIEPITDKDASLLPVHAPLDKAHAYHELHCSSDFATVFQFLKRFRRMGLKTSMDATIKTLASALTTSPPNKFLEELHVRLLTNINATISKNQDWTASFARFLASANPQPRTAGVDAFIASARTSSASSKRDESAAETPAALYAALRASERVALLKYVCEAQFDDNDALVERIGDQDDDALREEPGGTDASGRTYWAIEDAPSVLDGTVWVCRCTAAKAVHDSGDDAPSVWETVSDDLASLESLIATLALSTETADLQLWQRFSAGILKSLERRSKKQQASAARLARMPRMLGTSVAGLDLGSYVNDDGFGVRRSTRSRRTVTYRVESEEEDDEDEDNGDDGEEEEEEEAVEDEDDAESDSKDGSDDDDDDDGDGRPAKRSRRQAPARPPAPIGSRRSSRLRSDASPSPPRTSRSVPASPPRRRSDRHVAATRAARSSARRRRAQSRSSSSGSSSSESEEEEEEEEEETAEDSDDGDASA